MSCAKSTDFQRQPNMDARVVELVDSLASGASARKGVRVRLPPRAPKRRTSAVQVFFFYLNLSLTKIIFMISYNPVLKIRLYGVEIISIFRQQSVLSYGIKCSRGMPFHKRRLRGLLTISRQNCSDTQTLAEQIQRNASTQPRNR